MDEQITPVSPAPAPGNGAAAVQWPSAGSLLRQAWQIYKGRAQTLLLISLLGMVVIFIASIIFGGGLASVSGPGHSTAINTVAPLSAVINFIIILVVAVLAQGALFSAVSAQGLPTVGSAYSHAGKRLGALLWTGILSSIAIIVGFFLFVIPGVIFFVWFAVNGYIVMLEGKSGFGALKASKAYVRGRWAKVAWYMLVLALATIGFGIIAGIIAGVLSGISVYAGLIINLAFSVAILPMVSAYTYALYETLRDRPQT